MRAMPPQTAMWTMRRGTDKLAILLAMMAYPRRTYKRVVLPATKAIPATPLQTAMRTMRRGTEKLAILPAMMAYPRQTYKRVVLPATMAIPRRKDQLTHQTENLVVRLGMKAMPHRMDKTLVVRPADKNLIVRCGMLYGIPYC
ncbi:hypothetical protein PGT21_034488 [Puccinia graminis f. sp. tritici]|uniref:Uncharacterized protein n=1 Tax=Puccinia graminis f. sp. tritici TaxID=56615 RepID=A0A5B0NE28_PUCGR|nr:hypothetical protein PGT21_034488 [Puccinia graminis f. sp. tritici]KAA1138318.1 hypothetical protein PGTUg99_030217 [Puccinia graminis f. sp. tritici]